MMSNNVTYTFYVDSGGVAVDNAQPIFDSFLDLDGSVVDVGPRELVGAKTLPEFVSLNNGFYYFQLDWDSFSGNAYLCKIKCGDENDFPNPEQRFIIMRLDRNDNLSNVVNAIKTSSDDVVQSNTALLKAVNRMLEVELGTWKIEQVNGKVLLRIYPTGGDGEDPLFETSLDPEVHFAEHELFNEAGAPSAINPFTRKYSNVTALPEG